MIVVREESEGGDIETNMISSAWSTVVRGLWCEVVLSSIPTRTYCGGGICRCRSRLESVHIRITIFAISGSIGPLCPPVLLLLMLNPLLGCLRCIILIVIGVMKVVGDVDVADVSCR